MHSKNQQKFFNLKNYKMSYFRKTIFKEDYSLWLFLFIVSGITVTENNVHALTYIPWIMSSIIHVCFVYGLFCFSLALKYSGTVIVGSYIVLSFFTCLLWHLVFRRRKVISALLHKICKAQKILGISRKKSSAINVLVLAITSLPFLAGLVSAFDKLTDRGADTFWSLSYKIRSTFIQISLNQFCYIMFIFVNTSIPCLITLFVCRVAYRCREMLNMYKKALQNISEVSNINHKKNLLLFHYELIKILREFKTTFSAPLFVLILCSCAMTLNSFFILVLLKEWYFRVVLEISIYTTLGTTLLIALSLCGSLIPDGLMEIRETYEDLIERYEYLGTNNELLVRLKRLERKEIIYMTACGIINIRRNLIFSVFGTLLSYGLLIINISYEIKI